MTWSADALARNRRQPVHPIERADRLLRAIRRKHPQIAIETARQMMPDVRHCRVCGCSDEDACRVTVETSAAVEADLPPCCWVELDLCSYCAPVSAVLQTEIGQRWLLAVGDAIVSAEEEEEVEESVLRDDLDDVCLESPGNAA